MSLDEKTLAALSAWAESGESEQVRVEEEKNRLATSIATKDADNPLKDVMLTWESTGINPSNLEKFFLELSAVVDIPISKLQPEANLVSDLELDTFRYYTMVVLAENLFHERIPDSKLLHITTLADFIKCFTS